MKKEYVIIITGAGGFVGSRFVEYNKTRYKIIPLSLREPRFDQVSWNGVDVVVHLAGKAHEMTPIPDKIYYDVNYDLTRLLAVHAIEQGVRHFIYISSTKVYGDEVNQVFDEKSACHPTDPYGKSKLMAEQWLQSQSSVAFKVAIVRPPLVYGPHVKGNMLKLLHLSDSGMPLPFGSSDNQRSVVFVDNLIALINTIIERQAEGIFVAGDAKPVSTGLLVKAMRNSMQRRANTVAMPGLFKMLLRKMKPALYARLYGSFVVQNENTNRTLDFTPPVATEDGIHEMVQWFKASVQSKV
ncbi:NAD-dependent epimerase/dehydratase family protein [uncultured Chitinophaga sp.]|jgi:Nucleoside-diphosphate-sugar epimerases|uniref:NAD-dependent epimerase/dehydratase family protein n=1 Tax=uncultured Chitinophaga sp. TaxID=339340 RepID=UPI0026335F42|nr:NAD-dependent epimerase/dehydratase family protein [uncultured Chitinophaga sp.]